MGGSGESVQPLQYPLPKLHLLLVWPEVHISTAWAFKAYDRQEGDLVPPSLCDYKKDLTKPKVKATQIFPAQALFLQDIIDNLTNDLEGPIFSSHPSLRELKQEILAGGAIGAAMSGSGSSIYGIFSNAETAKILAIQLRKKFKTVYQFST